MLQRTHKIAHLNRARDFLPSTKSSFHADDLQEFLQNMLGSFSAIGEGLEKVQQTLQLIVRRTCSLIVRMLLFDPTLSDNILRLLPSLTLAILDLQ